MVKSIKVKSVVIFAILFLLLLAGGAYYFFGRQHISQPLTYNTIKSQPTKQPANNSSASPEPTISDAPTTQVNNKTYQVPAGWQKYSDSESGVTIYYPSQYTAKYNPNKGVGTNFAAGSFLLDSSGKKVMDFYKFPYNGGSRREAFYDTMEFDGPEDMSKFTVSASDIMLNGRTYLKIVSSYWASLGNYENQVFYLTPFGNQLYYFTYRASFENNPDDYKNLLTIIATSNLTAGTGTNLSQYTSCFPRPNSSNVNDFWQAKIENGDMVITQRTNKQLKQQVIDKSKISIWGNLQNSKYDLFSIIDFDVYIDSSKKGKYEDAFVIKIKNKDVNQISQETPSSVPSVAIIISINGGVETVDSKLCKVDLYGYYAPKP